MNSFGSTPLQDRQDLQQLLHDEQLRLEEEVGLRIDHFRRPEERAFTAAERSSTTILFGGLNWRHDYLIKAVFERCGYRCEHLPTPDSEAFDLGYRYCCSGQCNPVYFTAGSLIQFLLGLERRGLSRQEIIDRYIFFIARSCGPCRFGMYEVDYRRALDGAGFSGFRVIPFEVHKGIGQENRQGMQYSNDFGMGVFKALQLGDLMRDLTFQIRPYEVNPGETDQVFNECLRLLYDFIRNFDTFELVQRIPHWLKPRVRESSTLFKTLNSTGKIYRHLYGDALGDVLSDCKRRINQIEVDRLQPKPVVKLTGELFAHLTEGAGNYDVFSFLEQEGAQVYPDPVGGLLMHVLHQKKSQWESRGDLLGPFKRPRVWEIRKQLTNRLSLWRKVLPFAFGEWMYKHQYQRHVRALGDLAHPMMPQSELAELARPYYHPLLRGGEAHLEVAKSIYCTTHNLAHMILSMKPFGCMPSVQSDGVQSAVQEKYKDLIFLSIETSGNGAALAQSRVQMALSEARSKAREEFENTLKKTKKSLGQLKDFIESCPELKMPLYHCPKRPGVTGVGANFAAHISAVMDGRERLAKV